MLFLLFFSYFEKFTFIIKLSGYALSINLTFVYTGLAAQGSTIASLNHDLFSTKLERLFLISPILFQGDTMMVLYSYSSSDPNVTAESFPPHGTNRGSKYIFFQNQPKVPDIFPPPATYRLPLQISNVSLRMIHLGVILHTCTRAEFFFCMCTYAFSASPSYFW